MVTKVAAGGGGKRVAGVTAIYQWKIFNQMTFIVETVSVVGTHCVVEEEAVCPV